MNGVRANKSTVSRPNLIYKSSIEHAKINCVSGKSCTPYGRKLRKICQRCTGKTVFHSFSSEKGFHKWIFLALWISKMAPGQFNINQIPMRNEVECEWAELQALTAVSNTCSTGSNQLYFMVGRVGIQR